jgi:hypothetical protein
VPHATKHLYAVLGPMRDEDHAYEITADLITVKFVSAVLGFGVSIWVFCSLCWRVVRRKGLEDHDFLLQSSVLMLIVCAVYFMVRMAIYTQLYLVTRRIDAENHIADYVLS